MKKTRLILTAALCLLVSALCYADGTIIPVDQLPAPVKAFVKAQFPELTVAYAEKDTNEYEVRLNNGAELEFNAKGEWKKVDCKFEAVPATIVPAAIAAYFDANLPDQKVSAIERDRGGFDIECLSGLELRFDKNGKLLKVKEED